VRFCSHIGRGVFYFRTQFATGFLNPKFGLMPRFGKRARLVG
jgi:hypothetical protein